MIFEQIRTGGDRNFGYLLADRDAGQGVLIDPSYSPEVVVKRAFHQGISITHIINTHGHTDHTNGNDLASKLTGASITAHPESPATADVQLTNGQKIKIGKLQLECRYTPGHCADHIVLYEPENKVLITGDLLFVGKVGGTKNDDDARVEWESLQSVIETIPDEVTVWPGHDYGARPSSTIGLEKATNPFLRCSDVTAFLQLKHEWSKIKQQLGLV